MRQILQNLRSGETFIADVPVPNFTSQSVLIRTTKSLISSGTERMLVNFGKSGLIEKARSQPQKVIEVINKIKTDGFFATFDAVQSKLDTPIPLGYCNVGIVDKVGHGVKNLQIGDRVISNGCHAGYVNVQKNLVAKIPDNVTDLEAAFVVPGSIALQGIRLANPTIGENFVVIGVGLIGLLTVQILLAHGCKVLAVDFDQSKLELAKAFGASICNPSKGDDPIEVSKDFSKRLGVDGVIITAASESNEIISQAAKMCRKRGRIVLVGVTGLTLNRDDFYEKELTFQVSCSYGPGRYDKSYEDDGNDYPMPFVRWTENRNFQAILELLNSKKIDVLPLVSKKYTFENILEAYRDLVSSSNLLGLLIDYSKEDDNDDRTISLEDQSLKIFEETPVVDFIGAGNYSSRVLIPSFKKTHCTFNKIATSGGTSGSIFGKKFKFKDSTTDISSIFANPQSNTVVIATRHDTHAKYVCEAIKANKNIFVEKPLAINQSQIEQIKEEINKSKAKGLNPKLMVGFNRRFSPHIKKMKKLLNNSYPKSFIFTVNAGQIEKNNWVHDRNVGGGRIIGEACHFIDLMRFLADSPITKVSASGFNKKVSETNDTASLIISFKDGSHGIINYFSNGAKNYPKERIEVFCDGKILCLTNFIKLKGYGWNNFNTFRTFTQDKGQKECSKAFIDSIIKGTESPIPLSDILEVAEFSIKAAECLEES